MDEGISMVRLKSGAAAVPSAFLNERGMKGTIRIDLGSRGCCDPSLTLSVDHVREDDLVAAVEGIGFVINPDVYRLVGGVTISNVHEKDSSGFVVPSRKPVSEWEGFGLCRIKI
jgi:Fe-S cluster assembly iron-binding protein IscA